MQELAGLSPIVYHYTHLSRFANIVKSNVFQASPVISADAELDLSKGYLYYFSTSRSPNNKYTRMLGMQDVTLTLDGRKLGNTYKAHPVDYWGEEYRKASGGSYEQEDRILLNKAEIPNALSYIKEVKIYVDRIHSQKPEQLRALREAFRKLASAHIPVYIYMENSAYRLNKKKESLSPLEFIKKTPLDTDPGYVESPYMRNLRRLKPDRLAQYVAYIKVPVHKVKDLPKDSIQDYEKYLKYDDNYLKEFTSQFKNELHSAKTDQDARKSLAFILEYMRKNKLDAHGFSKHLHEKWTTQPKREAATMKTLVTAYSAPEWFKKMSKDQQKTYLEDHPNSKIAKSVGNSEGTGPNKAPAKKAAGKIKTGAPAQDILEKKGSPTKFKGPRSVGDSVSGKPKVERKVVSRLDKLAQAAKAAKEAGKEAPDYDLCQVSIPGTNLFCSENKGIPRKEMPQLKGTPTENSWADTNLPKDKNGEVDAEGAFKAMLKRKKVKTNETVVDAASLKATQSQLVGAKIAGMFQALKKEPNHPGITAPIYVSKDGYILDGHHRWAAMVALDMADGLKESVQMPVIQVDMDIESLVKATNDFASEIGIAQKAGKVKEKASCSDCGTPTERVASVRLTQDALAGLAKLEPVYLKKPVKASAVKHLEEHISLAADNVMKLRKADVYRVIDSAPAKERKALGQYIALSRDDLQEEVREVLAEDFNIELNGTKVTAATPPNMDDAFVLNRTPAERAASKKAIKDLQKWFNSDDIQTKIRLRLQPKPEKPLSKWSQEVMDTYTKLIMETLPAVDTFVNGWNKIKVKVDKAYRAEDAETLSKLGFELHKYNVANNLKRLKIDARLKQHTLKVAYPYLQIAANRISIMLKMPSKIKAAVEDMRKTPAQREATQKRSAAMRQRWGSMS